MTSWPQKVKLMPLIKPAQGLDGITWFSELLFQIKEVGIQSQKGG